MVRFSGSLIVPRNRHAGLQPWVRADDAASATTASKAPEVFCKAPGGYHKERAPESTEQVGPGDESAVDVDARAVRDILPE